MLSRVNQKHFQVYLTGGRILSLSISLSLPRYEYEALSGKASDDDALLPHARYPYSQKGGGGIEGLR